MNLEKENYKIVAGIAIGAIGGLLLGKYVWGQDNSETPLSKHLKTLSEVLEQIEGLDTEDAKDIKERIHNVLNSIESTYGITKE